MIPAFSPLTGLSSMVKTLFSAGEQGVWYDPSDFSTMFQDAAGTVPVTAVGQPVGLILDKSKGAIRNNGNAEYNILRYTEDLSNSYWATTYVSKSVAVAPDGTNTAIKITPNTSNLQHHILPAPGVPVGQWKYSFYAKADGYRYLGVWGINQLSYLDLIDGVVAQKSVDHSTVNITKLNNGWNYIDIRFTPYNPNSYRVYPIETVGTPSFAGNGTSGILLWHPDLRLAAYADVEPVYQRKGAGSWLSEIPGNHAFQATTASRPTLQIDTAGNYFLSFDGVDDSLVTGNINFSATDKMTVFAAVRKLADGFQVIAELSDPTTSSGSSSLLFVSASVFSGKSYASIIRSGSNEAFVAIGPYAAPIQSVVSVRIDRTKTTAIEEILYRHNAQNKSLTVGTNANPSGDFGSFPLSIGRRGQSGPFNGRLYGLIVRGAATDDLHLTHAEKYLAYKSGVSL